MLVSWFQKEDQSRISWDDKSDFCVLKINGIKTIVKSYLPIKDAYVHLGIDGLLNILINMLSYREISKDLQLRHSVHPDHSVQCEHFEHIEYFVAGDYEYYDFEHSTTNFHTENMAQPPPREDPLKNLKEFHIFCSTMKPPDVQEDHIFLKAFPYSMEGVAKDWLYYLAPRSIFSRDDLKRVFLEKFFPGLSNMERSMIDVANGGALGDMTPAEARNLIEKMASNSQQFSARNDAIVLRGVHEVATDSSSSTGNKKLEGKLDALVNLVTQLAMNQKSAPVARVCGLCSSVDHHTDLCPSL
ncbi:hypothetical protein D0Y65_038361 [Glycine soja]|uniref:Retrotransposon gag domain-containing protein n=1 Tax=Glycine soja TaxID=3848 RepID=A0A445H581_GLYSO|nr:hypothetical protein D0Y65_038361 [Glycine soja]